MCACPYITNIQSKIPIIWPNTRNAKLPKLMDLFMDLNHSNVVREERIFNGHNTYISNFVFLRFA